MNFDWALEDPGKTKVESVEGDALGTSDLSVAFDSAMQFENTTKGSRTFFFHDDGGVNVGIRYPGGSPVCKYAENSAADDERTCFVRTSGGSFVGIRFKDFPALNDLTEGEVTKVVRTTHELTLPDVPEAEAEADQVAAALLNYEQVLIFLHYGDTTDKFKTSCDQAALENVDYASLYLVLGTVGSMDHCKA
jgi:hypothetical protein